MMIIPNDSDGNMDDKTKEAKEELVTPQQEDVADSLRVYGILSKVVLDKNGEITIIEIYDDNITSIPYIKGTKLEAIYIGPRVKKIDVDFTNFDSSWSSKIIFPEDKCDLMTFKVPYANGADENRFDLSMCHKLMEVDITYTNCTKLVLPEKTSGKIDIYCSHNDLRSLEVPSNTHTLVCNSNRKLEEILLPLGVRKLVCGSGVKLVGAESLSDDCQIEIFSFEE